MKSFAVQFAIFAVLLFVTSSHAFDAEDLGDDEAKTITVSNNQLFLALNSTTLLVGGIALMLGLALVALFVIGLPAAAPADPNFEKSQYQNYYDPDLAAADSPYADAALAYAYSAHQQQQDAYRQKRSLGVAYNLATKMLQLESAFKKYEVKTQECQMAVACEAAQIHKLKDAEYKVQAVHSIMSNINQGDESKISPAILAAYRLGQANQGKKDEPCQTLKQMCEQ